MRIHYEMKILLADSLLIIFFAMSLIVSLHGFEFKVCFANSIRIHYLFWDYTKNSPSVSRIQFESTIFFEILLRIRYLLVNIRCIQYQLAKILLIDYQFREFTINQLHLLYLFCDGTLNSLSFLRIHYLFNGDTMSSLSVLRIHFDLSIASLL